LKRTTKKKTGLGIQYSQNSKKKRMRRKRGGGKMNLKRRGEKGSWGGEKGGRIKKTFGGHGEGS